MLFQGIPEPEIHHSDQGVQYAAREYEELLEEHEIEINMAARGRPEQNVRLRWGELAVSLGLALIVPLGHSCLADSSGGTSPSRRA